MSTINLYTLRSSRRMKPGMSNSTGRLEKNTCVEYKTREDHRNKNKKLHTYIKNK